MTTQTVVDGGPDGRWDAPAFERAEYDQRVAATRIEMEKQGLDALVVTSPENLYYLTGYESLGYYQFQAGVVERGRDRLWLVLHEVEAGVAALSTWVQDVEFWRHAGTDRALSGVPGDPASVLIERLRRSLPSPARVGFEKDANFLPVSIFERLRRELAGPTLVDASALLPRLRAIKSPREIEYMRRAAGLSDLGVQAARDAARVGVREVDLLAAVNHTLAAAGSEYPCLPPMILSGPRTVAVHQSASSRPIGNAEPITVELAGVVRRYNSNILRSFHPIDSVGVRDDFLYARDLLATAIERCTAMAGPGIPGAELDRESRRITAAHDRYRLHRTGYGLEAGFPPAWVGSLSLSVDDPMVLQPGMVLSIEPTLIFYDYPPETRFSALMGNNILVTQDGVETLNATPLLL